MANQIATNQLQSAARALAFRGSKDGCIDLKSKKVEQGKLFSPEAKAGLKALTAEDGSETEVRQCRFTDASNNGYDVLVMAKIRASQKADGFDISVDAKAFTTGKAGKEVASFSGLMKAK